MARLSFTPNLRRHVETPVADVAGDTVRAVLGQYFEANPRVRPYVLDDQGSVRKHVVIFLNRQPIRDRKSLADAVGSTDEIFVMQALSGG